ncbi:hypothetical protein BT69DRAFT_788937 [Atractiella rhizophila]|nr:hypothetical protein BT69DRAFT_788937 [Atractiella rhizophila]
MQTNRQVSESIDQSGRTILNSSDQAPGSSFQGQQRRPHPRYQDNQQYFNSPFGPLPILPFDSPVSGNTTVYQTSGSVPYGYEPPLAPLQNFSQPWNYQPTASALNPPFYCPSVSYPFQQQYHQRNSSPHGANQNLISHGKRRQSASNKLSPAPPRQTIQRPDSASTLSSAPPRPIPRSRRFPQQPYGLAGSTQASATQTSAASEQFEEEVTREEVAKPFEDMSSLNGIPSGSGSGRTGSTTSPLRGYDQLNNILIELGDLKVDQLKQAIRMINSSPDCHGRMNLSGRKDELHHRIKMALSTAQTTNSPQAFHSIAQIITDVANDRIPNGNGRSPSLSSPAVEYRPNYHAQPPPPPKFASLASSSSMAKPYESKYSSGAGAGSWTKNPYNNLPGTSQGVFRPSVGGLATVNAQQSGNLPMNFRTSPFYRPIAAVSDIVTLNKAGQNDRRTVVASINLTEWQRSLLTETNPDPDKIQHQLRVFCASEDYYIVPPPHRTSNYTTHPKGLIPMEFPVQCELKLNGSMVSGNLRGIKKVPGTAAPPNLGVPKKDNGEPVLELRPGAFNRAELSYANIEKRHFMQVYLCEVTSVKQLMDKLKKGKFRSKEEVLKKIKEKAADEDVVMEASELSLKCPVSFVRMTTPCRSWQCSHLQCFEAMSFLSMMEMTPTWLCPVCNKKITTEDLARDGYTEDIMAQVPDSVEAVLVEADGTWRSTDNTYGNAKDVGKPKEPSERPAPQKRDSTSSLRLSAPESQKPKSDVIIMDDSDEDGVSYGGSNNPSSSRTDITAPSSTHNGLSLPSTTPAVIDLTLSEDDEPVVPPPRPSKRRAPDDWDDDRGNVRPRISERTVWN